VIGALRNARPLSTVDWNEAAQAMAEKLTPEDYVIITPGWAISVVRYCLRNQPQVRVEGADLMELTGRFAVGTFADPREHYFRSHRANAISFVDGARGYREVPRSVSQANRCRTVCDSQKAIAFGE
jgi:hypothetical protein